jgi:hypothetical protein
MPGSGSAEKGRISKMHLPTTRKKHPDRIKKDEN